MALTTFGGIKAAAQDWLQRADLSTVVAADLWSETVSMMYYGDRAPGTAEIPRLRIRQMVTSGTLTPDASGNITISSALGANFLEIIELTPTYSGAQSLNYRDPWSYRKEAALLYGVAPAQMYTIEGDTLLTAPSTASTIIAYWYQKFTALSADGDTDWIVLNAPQVYLNGLLYQACAYLEDDRLGQFRAMFAGGIDALNQNDKRARQSGATKRSTPRAVA